MVAVGRNEFEDEYREMFDYYRTWARNSKQEEQMVQELDEFYQMQSVQWSTETKNVPYWVVRCIAVWSKFNIKKAKTLCMSFNHSSGYGCLKGHKGKCDYTHECLFCSSKDHGVYILKPNGKFVCPKVQAWSNEQEKYTQKYGVPDDEGLKALARTPRPPDFQHGAQVPGRTNSVRGNAFNELRSETDGESESAQDAPFDSAEPQQHERESHNKVPQPRRASSIQRTEPRRTQALGGSNDEAESAGEEGLFVKQDSEDGHTGRPKNLLASDAAWPSLGAKTGNVPVNAPGSVPPILEPPTAFTGEELFEPSPRDTEAHETERPRQPPPPPPPVMPPQSGSQMPSPPLQVPPPGLLEPKLFSGPAVKLVEEEASAPLPPALSQTPDVAQLPRGPPPKPPGRAKAPPPFIDSLDHWTEPPALARLERAVPGSAEMLKKAKVLHLENGAQYAEKLLEWVVQNEAAELQELADSAEEVANFAGMKPLPAQRLKRALLSIVDRMAL